MSCRQFGGIEQQFAPKREDQRATRKLAQCLIDQTRNHFLLYFKDGKIVSSHEYLDSLHLTDVFFDGARPE